MSCAHSTTCNKAVPLPSVVDDLPDDLILQADDHALLLDSESEGVHAEVHLQKYCGYDAHWDLRAELTEADSLSEYLDILKKYKSRQLLDDVIQKYKERKKEKE
jgi:hypothetical protein